MPDEPKVVAKVDSKQWMLKTRQLMKIGFAANVYEAGNNTLEEVDITLRWDAIFGAVGEALKTPSSEAKLRSILEKFVEPEVKRKLLLLHTSSHAVDDVRINRQQLQELLDQWSDHNLVDSHNHGARKTWVLTKEGERRVAVMSLAKQVI